MISISYLTRSSSVWALAILIMLWSPNTLAQNSSLSLDLNDDAVRLSWAHLNSVRKFHFGASALHHQDRGTLLAGSFHITGNAATAQRPLNAGLGGRLNYADTKRDGVLIPEPDGYGLSVGGFFDAKLPNYDRVGFGGHLYYAPDVLSFGDLEELTDIWLYGSYSVVRQGDVYIGVRHVKGDFGDLGEQTFDTGFHAGFKLKF